MLLLFKQTNQQTIVVSIATTYHSVLTRFAFPNDLSHLKDWSETHSWFVVPSGNSKQLCTCAFLHVSSFGLCTLSQRARVWCLCSVWYQISCTAKPGCADDWEWWSAKDDRERAKLWTEQWRFVSVRTWPPAAAGLLCMKMNGLGAIFYLCLLLFFSLCFLDLGQRYIWKPDWLNLCPDLQLSQTEIEVGFKSLEL